MHRPLNLTNFNPRWEAKMSSNNTIQHFNQRQILFRTVAPDLMGEICVRIEMATTTCGSLHSSTLMQSKHLSCTLRRIWFAWILNSKKKIRVDTLCQSSSTLFLPFCPIATTSLLVKIHEPVLQVRWLCLEVLWPCLGYIRVTIARPYLGVPFRDGSQSHGLSRKAIVFINL